MKMNNKTDKILHKIDRLYSDKSDLISENFFDFIGSAASKVWNNLSGAAKSVYDKVNDVIKNGFQAFIDWCNKKIDSLTDFDEAKSFLGGLFNRIGISVTNESMEIDENNHLFFESEEGLWSKLKNGIKNAWDFITTSESKQDFIKYCNKNGIHSKEEYDKTSFLERKKLLTDYLKTNKKVEEIINKSDSDKNDEKTIVSEAVITTTLVLTILLILAICLAVWFIPWSLQKTFSKETASEKNTNDKAEICKLILQDFKDHPLLK